VVAESYTPGAVVSAVARRWQIAPQQLFTWRREARVANPEVSGAAALGFVPMRHSGPAPFLILLAKSVWRKSVGSCTF
jgi:transposase